MVITAAPLMALGAARLACGLRMPPLLTVAPSAGLPRRVRMLPRAT